MPRSILGYDAPTRIRREIRTKILKVRGLKIINNDSIAAHDGNPRKTNKKEVRKSVARVA